MHATLTIQERLKDLRVVDRNLTLEQLAQQTGISRAALGKYESDDLKDISPFSIVTLAKFYGVSTDYLLGLTEQKNHPDTDLEELHLSDEMIALLKSGKINNRLLCEMAAHDHFQRFMTDMEIYVDGIAAMQIQNLNSVVDMARIEIEERYHPAEDDRYMQTLQAAHIDEDSYFAQMIHRDIDVIAQDLHAVHTKDSDTAPGIGVAENIKHIMKDAADFRGSEQEKQLYTLCETLQIDYTSLTESEFEGLIKALGKSKVLKSVMNQRGKGNAHKKQKKRR